MIFSLTGRFQCFSLIRNELVTDKLPKNLIECSQPFHSEECTKLMFLNNTYKQAYYNQEKLLFRNVAQLDTAYGGMYTSGLT